MKTSLCIPAGLGLAVAISLGSNLAGQSAAFTYQGRVRSGGSDFSGAGQFKFALVTATNTAATATATANAPSGGFITVINVTFGGSGYVSPPAVTITGGGSAGATATASISGGVVTDITVNLPGGGYTTTPMVTIAPPPESLAYTTYWSNDGTSVAGSEPSGAVSMPVNGGLFTVKLGDATLANMMAIDAALFAQPDLQLRIWFNDGVNGFAALSPAQSLTPAPYANFAYLANGLPGMVVQSNTNGAPNLIGGSPNNLATDGVVGATIGGGGATNYFGGSYTNKVTADFGTVGGGSQNTAGRGATAAGGSLNNASGAYATIGGGNNNMSSGLFAFVGGGSGNIASDNWATVAGGNQNTDSAHAGSIGGGDGNVIGTNANWSTIGGGNGNSIQTNIEAGTIAGGLGNSIGGNAGSMTSCSIGGGRYNVIQATDSTISGGFDNEIGLNAIYAAIGGGWVNSAQGNNAAIGGGDNNLASGGWTAIPGGYHNTAAGEFSLAAGRQAQANHQGAMVWADSTAADFPSQRNDQFRVRAHGGARFDVNSNGWVEVFAKTTGGIFNPVAKFIDTSTGAYLSSGGVWANSSDRNAKENFQPVDPRRILEQVSALPITRWNYRVEGSAVQHIGPVAQDFQGTFRLSADDTHIATLDEGGVALAAVQGLNQKLEQKETEITELKSQNASLVKRLEALERIVLQRKSN